MSMGTGERNQASGQEQYGRESLPGRTGSTTPTGTHSEYEAEYDTSSRAGNGGSSTPEISADIEHTRRKMGRRIDQIQAKLDPDRLMGEAQNAVRDVLADTANSITDYLRDNRDQITGSVARAARRNPVPTALVGLGLGWLLLESMGGGSSNNRRNREWERERQRRDRYQYQRQMRSRDMYGDPYGDAYDESYATGDDAEYASRGFTGSYASTTYGMAGQSSGSGSSGYNRSEAVYRDAYGNAYDPADERYTRRSGRSQESGRGPIAKAKDAVSHVAETVKNQVEGVVQTVQDKAGDIQDKAGDVQHQMRHQASQLGERAEEQWSETGERFQETGQRMRRMTRQRSQQLQRGLEDNPLTYAALALVAGAAVAYLLPQTRVENEAMGHWRDRIMDDADEMMHEAAQRAQRVVEEVRPELEQSARALGQELKQTAKEIGQRAGEEIHPVVERAREAAKDEARQAAAERGIGQKNQPQGSTGQSGTGQSGSGSSMSGTPGATTGTGSTGQGNLGMGSSSQSTIGQSSQSTSGSQGATGAKSGTTGMGSTAQGMAGQGSQSTSGGQGKSQFGTTVDRSKFQERWNDLRGSATQRWSKLTAESLSGSISYEQMVGLLQQHYSYTKPEAEREVDEFLRQYGK